jgi:hypothetical protein
VLSKRGREVTDRFDGHDVAITDGVPSVLGGGGNDAAILLEAYDAQQARFRLPKDSEFWDAVALAHEVGRLGAGRRVAVVDDGFDLTLPALSSREAWLPSARPTVHGTAAALLVTEVAPECDLRLYSASVDGELTVDAMIAALNAAVADGAEVISMSLGVPYRNETRMRAPFGAATGDAPEGLQPDDWRVTLAADATPLADAARRAVAAGVTLVVAVGNSSAHVYTPSSTPSVVAVGFHTVVRDVLDGLLEVTRSASPASYSQSEGCDVLLVQPQGVVGSSFACPLVAGFAALMRDPGDLLTFAHLVARRHANAAGQLAVLPHDSSDNELHTWIDSLFLGALNALPHPHDPSDGPCPECALFAAPVYIDFGLLRLGLHDLQSATQLLSTAVAISPRNAHARANLGVALATLAYNAVCADELDAADLFLAQAAEHLAASLQLRPAVPAVEARLLEVRKAREDPTRWTLAP